MAVVITQVGVVTPFGRGVAAFQKGLEQSTTALSHHEPLKWMDSSLAGVISNKQFRQYLKRRKAAN